MRPIAALMMLFFLKAVCAAHQALVFVSFSMPDTLLHETLKESASLHIPAYLNGLYHDSMAKTVAKVMNLAKETPDLNLQIDPTAFERFGIHQVPALVIEGNHTFDVIYGHLTLKEGIRRIAGGGESGFSITDARILIGE